MKAKDVDYKRFYELVGELEMLCEEQQEAIAGVMDLLKLYQDGVEATSKKLKEL